MILSNRVWRLGDNVDTDQILPGSYINLPDKALRASHCFENIYPGFSSLAKPGELIVAGLNFGCGSSRPSVEILQDLGLGGVVAQSFARIFFRGGIARGFPLMVCPSLQAGDLPTGHHITVNLEEGTLVDQDSGALFSIEPYPKFFQEIMEARGLLNYTRTRMDSEVR
jgi:3-isopropylmalate/(R)-2-methylmalate dehydratase small subunit